jgi:uncharacterized protein
VNDMRFSGLLDLARLPYFDVRGGRLCLADAALGPAVDVHTHLALSYGPCKPLDLLADSGPTEHYLPPGRPLDLDVYINRNFLEEDLRELERDLTFRSFTRGGMRRTHTIPGLTREMGELGVRASVLLPIDFPVMSQNAKQWLRASHGRPELICFGSIHPYSRKMCRRLDEQLAMGVRGIKVHPGVQMVGPDDNRAMKLYRLCGERRLPVLFHCGPVGIDTKLGRSLSQVSRYERALAENPSTVFILGHSGALQMEQALAFSQRYDNVYLEVSSQSLGNVHRIVREAPPERVLFGTDWPFYHQAIGLAKVFLATEGDDAARRRVLHRNAERLLGLEPASPAGPTSPAVPPGRA